MLFPVETFHYSLPPGSRGSDSPGPVSSDTATKAELELPQVDATVVCHFVAHLFQNNLSSGTIQLYLSGLRFY